MTVAKNLLIVVAMAGGFMANAQFTPINLIALPQDYPGLVNNYTLVTVDANMATSGTPNWGLVETIDVYRNSGNMITGTEVHTTYPVPIHRATGSRTGNVYTAMVELFTAGTWVPYQRETIYSDGVNDTASTVENYDAGTGSYVNADHYAITYNTANRIASSSHYVWTAGAWKQDTRREITYSGTQYATDTTYKLTGSAWSVHQYKDHYYTAGVLDSSVWYERVGSAMAIKTIYSYDANTASQLHVIYNYTEAAPVWKLSSRIIFSGSPVAINPGTATRPPQVKVYPVPANDRLVIAVGGKVIENGRAVVTDITGRMVLETSLVNNKAQFSTAALAPSAYVVTVDEGGEIIYKSTIIVTH